MLLPVLVDKVGVLCSVQQPGSYWDRSSTLPPVGLKPTDVTLYWWKGCNLLHAQNLDFSQVLFLRYYARTE